MIETRLRTLQLGLAGFGFIGLLVELLLQGHTSEALQWTPIILIGLGLLGVALGLFAPKRWVVVGLRVVGPLIAVGAALGVVLHLSAAMAAERELIGAAAFGELLQGVLLVYHPPLLAPGALAVGGLLLVACTYRHPAIESRGNG